MMFELIWLWCCDEWKCDVIYGWFMCVVIIMIYYYVKMMWIWYDDCWWCKIWLIVYDVLIKYVYM